MVAEEWDLGKGGEMVWGGGECGGLGIGEGEGGGEEGVKLVLPEGDGEGVGEGVVEGGGAGHLAFPLAEPGHPVTHTPVTRSPGHRVEEVAGRAAEGPLCRQLTRGDLGAGGRCRTGGDHLSAHPELGAAAGQGEVARVGAGVGRPGGHAVLPLTSLTASVPRTLSSIFFTGSNRPYITPS